MAEEARPSQCELVLRYMQDFGSITPIDALEQFSCMRLGARIWDLKHAGHKIKSELVSHKNVYGQPVHYARYSLITEEENAAN